MDNYLIRAIIGKADTDKGFEDFKVSWLKSGGQIDRRSQQGICREAKEVNLYPDISKNSRFQAVFFIFERI